jgi:hypothetical protein
MADQTFKNTERSGAQSASGSAPHGFEKAATTPRGVGDQVKSVADQALSAGRDLKEKAIDVAGSSAEALKGHAAGLMDSAKDVASQTTDKLKQTVDGQKIAGAEYVGSLANTMRRAAREFDSDLPIAGTYIRKAASQVEGMSESIKTGNLNDLVRGAQSFARRQPTAFLGMAVLAGFGVVRFLKSSADSSESGSSQRTGGDAFGGDHAASGRSYAKNTGYRDEFTK